MSIQEAYIIVINKDNINKDNHLTKWMQNRGKVWIFQEKFNYDLRFIN